jgi:hypothetical protein
LGQKLGATTLDLESRPPSFIDSLVHYLHPHLNSKENLASLWESYEIKADNLEMDTIEPSSMTSMSLFSFDDHGNAISIPNLETLRFSPEIGLHSPPF